MLDEPKLEDKIITDNVIRNDLVLTLVKLGALSRDPEILDEASKRGGALHKDGLLTVLDEPKLEALHDEVIRARLERGNGS